MARSLKWTDKYDVVGIKAGRIVMGKRGEIDLSDNSLPISLVDALYKEGCPYIKPKGDDRKE